MQLLCCLLFVGWCIFLELPFCNNCAWQLPSSINGLVQPCGELCCWPYKRWLVTISVSMPCVLSYSYAICQYSTSSFVNLRMALLPEITTIHISVSHVHSVGCISLASSLERSLWAGSVHHSVEGFLNLPVPLHPFTFADSHPSSVECVFVMCMFPYTGMASFQHRCQYWELFPNLVCSVNTVNLTRMFWAKVFLLGMEIGVLH